MSYIIYGAPGSGSGIIEAACAEIGVDYRIHDLDARNEEHRRAEYAAINPHRKMPSLQMPDGEVLAESVAIILTLDEQHREANILPPPGTKARAKALRWMVYLATEVYPLVEFIDYPERLYPEQPDAIRARAEEIVRSRWLLLEAHIESPYFLSTGFCATDLYITKLYAWLDERWRKKHLPKTETLSEMVRKRPTLATVWSRHIR